jgi:hypothetical protein
MKAEKPYHLFTFLPLHRSIHSDELFSPPLCLFSCGKGTTPCLLSPYLNSSKFPGSSNFYGHRWLIAEPNRCATPTVDFWIGNRICHTDFCGSHIQYRSPFHPYRFFIILAFVSSATQDIATDAMAARSLKREDTGLLNSIQAMGSFTGSMVGGGFLLLLFQN